MSARWLSAEPLWIADDGRSLQVLSRESGARPRLQGTLRDAVLAGDANDAHLAALSRVDAQAGELVRALQAGPPQPLTRADVLRCRRYGLLFIELTGLCNERCSHCYADASPERRERLDEATLRSVIDDAAMLGFAAVQLTGGDPLLSPHLVTAVAHARLAGIGSVEIFTNGLALTTDLLARLAPHAPRFAFSLYSDVAAEHDAVTQVGGSHARTLRAIARCRERQLPVRVGFVAMDDTSLRRDAVRALLQARGLTDVTLSVTPSRAVGRGRAIGALHGFDAHGLHDAGGKVAVAYTGDVYPCIFARHMRLGNVYERPLREVLADATPIVADPVTLHDRVERASERLSCMDCRITDALLTPVVERGSRLPVLA